MNNLKTSYDYFYECHPSPKVCPMTDKTTTVYRKESESNKSYKTTFLCFRNMVTNLADDGDTVNTHCTNKFWMEIKKRTPVTTFYSSNAFGSDFYAKLGKTSALSAWLLSKWMGLIECYVFYSYHFESLAYALSSF